MTASNPNEMSASDNESLGSLFRKTRRGLHHSIEDASEATRIHVRILRDLEDDNYRRMPAEVFVRGFIKLYAAFLGLDPEETLSIYVLQENAHPDKPAEMPYRQHILTGEKYVNPPLYQQSGRKVSVIGGILTILVLILVAVSFLPKNIDTPDTDWQGRVVPDPGTSTTILTQTEPPDPQEAEIIVDRPPGIKIDEEPASEPEAESGSSEPVEKSPILDRKPYKISKKPDREPPAAAPVIAADPEEKTQPLPEGMKPAPVQGVADSGSTGSTIDPATGPISTGTKPGAIVTAEKEASNPQPTAQALRSIPASAIEAIAEPDAPVGEPEYPPAADTPPVEPDHGTDTASSDPGDQETRENPPQSDPMAEAPATREVLRSGSAPGGEAGASEVNGKSTLVDSISGETEPGATRLSNRPDSAAQEIADDSGVQAPLSSPKPVTVKVVTVKSTAENIESEEDDSDPEPTAEANTPVNYVLEARFLEPTWMRIQVDSKKPRQYTYNPGMVRTWKAERSIFLHLGNGGGVSLTLNGKPLPTGSPSGKVAKISIPDDIR
ncbi:MAG: DUF4115 domain-containing protein [Proteobacteria bacterium]|nr:DUF4115 domain-containing protein [Pseudomonadota bacterium]MBU1738632.1 DUF4115 domain-containing protein [Pseudomonadota bacterium]